MSNASIGEIRTPLMTSGDQSQKRYQEAFHPIPLQEEGSRMLIKRILPRACPTGGFDPPEGRVLTPGPAKSYYTHMAFS